jgi:acetoacetyl-CoA synthetase
MTGRLLREPDPRWRGTTRIGEFAGWVEARSGRRFAGWDDLWRWSVEDLPGFWAAVWEHFGVESDAEWSAALEVPDHADPTSARWFPGARVNYARHALSGRTDLDDVAVLAYSQTRPPVTLSVAELGEQVARCRAGLVRLGVGRGDRVVAYLPNLPETLVAFLATASLGAVWASCAPEFGARGVLDRFAQLDPTVLLVVSGYRYGAKDVDRSAEVAAVRTGLPSLRHVVQVPYAGPAVPGALPWDALTAEAAALSFEPVPFDHPLCVLFSSGTTGRPKAIVHRHGGILLEHLKNHALSWDLGPGDRLMWFTTTAWMMWNALVSALLVRASIVMIDGDPAYPGLDAQWRLAAETGATVLGASPGFLMASRAAGLTPAKDYDLSRLKQLGAAGSPLPAEGYEWVHDQFGPAVLLNVGSGGTDVCTGIVQGGPLQPVRAGEISGPCLGVGALAYDASGRPVVGEPGELVITTPMPSMPVGFWGDADGSAYRAAYFEHFPGVWRHGDWVRFEPGGGCVITGRSDATLNRGGVRLGTAELYGVVEELPGVRDSLVVHLDDPAGGNGELLLFVVLADGGALDDALVAAVRSALRGALSPRHVPDAVIAVPAVPRNRTGKKLEVPVKRLLRGAAPDEALGRDTVADPAALDAFLELAARRRP